MSEKGAWNCGEGLQKRLLLKTSGIGTSVVVYKAA